MVKPTRSRRRTFSWASEVREVARDSLLREVVVACPNCQARTSTRLRTAPKNFRPAETMVRLACGACGFTAERQFGNQPWPKAGTDGQMVDPWFQAALWLQTRCVGQILWALNPQHLSYIHDYVASDVRGRREFAQFGSALGEQLPEWMVLAKNRPALLRSIAELGER